MFLESRNIHDSKNAPDTSQASESGGCTIGRGETGNTGDTRVIGAIGDTEDTGDTLKENHKLKMGSLTDRRNL